MISRKSIACWMVIWLGGCAAWAEDPPMRVAQPALVAGDSLQEALRDGGLGPELVLLPAGSFLMGSSVDEPGRYPNEGPVHRVTFARPFFLGKTEVTVAQFRRFVEATGYLTEGERNTGSFIRDADAEQGRWRLRKDINWRMDHEGKPSRDDNPVVHVSWNDAQAYLSWLSAQTGRHYRLPSEAELEYANRAGSRTPYWWGTGSPHKRLANIRGEKDEAVANPLTWDPTFSEFDYILSEGPTPLNFAEYGDGYHGLSPVASFTPNGFGLYDTTGGNVWEWAEDCWYKDYLGAPTDGSARQMQTETCDYRVVRGASFYCFPRHVRSANRWSQWPEARNMYTGFRVARDAD